MNSKKPICALYKCLYFSSLTLLTLLVMVSCGKKANKDKVAVAMDEIDSLFTAHYSIDGNENPKFTNPGGAVLIMKGDSILFDKGYGIANYEDSSKIDGNTFFNIASCSKQFSAVAILKMDDQKLIDIHKSIYDVSPKVLPYLPPKKAPFSAITVANLMSHSSGIPDARPRDDREFVLKATDMQSIEYMKNLDSLHFQPGTQYEYINPTFQLLYLFIEKISGLPFEQYMHDNIFVPAGMDSIVYFEPDRKIPHMAHGYVTDTPDAKEGAKKFHEYDYGEESFFATKADGGIYTSTHQFIKWIKALRDNKIISAKIKSEAQSPVTKVTGSKYCDYQNRPNTYYGYGWFIEQQPGFPLKVYHTGDNGGFQIYEAFFPSTNLTVLVFENRNDHDRWDMVTALDKILKKAGLMESAR